MSRFYGSLCTDRQKIDSTRTVFFLFLCCVSTILVNKDDRIGHAWRLLPGNNAGRHNVVHAEMRRPTPRSCRPIFCQCCVLQRRWEAKERQKWNDKRQRASSSSSRAEPSRAERSPAEPSRASETYVNWFKSIVVELNNSKTVAAADDWLTDRSAWWQDEHRHHAGPAFSPSPPTFDLHCAAHKFPPAYACLYSRRSEYYAANATPIDGDRDSIQVL